MHTYIQQICNLSITKSICAHYGASNPPTHKTTKSELEKLNENYVQSEMKKKEDKNPYSAEMCFLEMLPV